MKVYCFPLPDYSISPNKLIAPIRAHFSVLWVIQAM